MNRICCVFLLLSTLSAARETVLKADRNAHFLVLRDVYLNGHGPFKMMVDTGAASCIIRPAVAQKLALNSIYAVEHVTANGVQKMPATVLSDIGIGEIHHSGVEAIVTDPAFPDVDGVLGQSWLVLHDYLLDYHGRRLVLDAPAPESKGIVRASLSSSDGRPQIAADVDGRHQELVIDSGASALVLFGKHRLPDHAKMTTNSGTTEVTTGSARLTIAGSRTIRMTAAVVEDNLSRPGLLPASAFRSIHISNREGIVSLVP